MKTATTVGLVIAVDGELLTMEQAMQRAQREPAFAKRLEKHAMTLYRQMADTCLAHHRRGVPGMWA